MKHYETMFILKPTLTEEEIKAKIEFYKEAITKNGGAIETCLDMGMRNLAYEIKKNKRGYYFVIYFKAEPALILELERLYRINEDVLRFIVIKYVSKKEQKAWETLVDKANNPAKYAKKPKKEESKPPRETAKQETEAVETAVATQEV
ncbi:30S ribosomal protein S6 [Helicobacter enhydrae]|uniref:Small ribosomal subunit protein bS6 n=1 Tax=Helicobacter enhydrae TaxID=222136 RepID=A0A1B1U623_9HELI|nr:30S ribosomal protein S6 [Helicobacter enhydrae]ANV98206.1 30S ribosomal protein S6 [Helicobacter enhydrae]